MGTSTSIERANRALLAGQRARIVQHASLRPAHEDDAAQMGFAVEDALNTADFADCGRLIVVRRLKLAAVPPRASAAWMARAMESAWRVLAMQAVPVAHPSAASAQAVYFASRVEARLAWLRCVANGQPVDAWFWAAAMPELKVSAGRTERVLDAVVEGLLREAAPAVVVATLNAWPDAAVLSLGRAMPVGSHRAMLGALTVGTPMVGVHANSAAPVVAAKALPEALLTVAARLSRDAPLAEEAAAWIAGLWMAPVLARAPTLDEVQAVVTRAVWLAAGLAPVAKGEDGEAWAGMPSAAEREDEWPDGGGRLGSVAASDQTAVARGTQDLARRDTASAPAPVWRVESGLKATERRRSRSIHAQLESPRGLPWLANAEFTANGGLMLVLNVLRAMRFDSASQALVDGLMLHLLDAVGAPEVEPQRAWFEGRGVPSRTQDGDFDRLSPTLRYLRASGGGVARRGASIPQPERVFRVVCVHSRPFGLTLRQAQDRVRLAAYRSPLPLALRYRRVGLSLSKASSDSLPELHEEPLDPQLRLWRIRLRRTLRRHVGLDLPALIRRPAWVSATATHIDVVYPMSDIDLRLRRRGLDADPGWVPWFGRIVTFHFIDDDLLPSRKDDHG